jgi:glucose-1-phosphate thymidylyltransferase
VDVVGVVPAAGYATRLQPLDRSKEMLEVGGRVLMDHVVERMRVAGCRRIRVVTRPEKTDVVAHARHLDAEVVLGRPATLSGSILLGIAGLPAEAAVLIGFPDSIWEPVDGFGRLLERLDAGWQIALGLFLWDEPWRSDVVTVDRSGAVTQVELRPRRQRPGWVWGCAAARAGILAGLRGTSEPGELLASACRTARVAGVRLSATYADLGTKEALAEANAQARLSLPATDAR